MSLAAAEGLGDGEKVSRQLQNIADALLLASRQQHMFHLGIGFERLEHAEAVIKRLRLEGTPDLIVGFGSHRLLAEVLCDFGRVDEALQVLDESRDEANACMQLSGAATALVEARCLRLASRSRKPWLPPIRYADLRVE